MIGVVMPGSDSARVALRYDYAPGALARREAVDSDRAALIQSEKDAGRLIIGGELGEPVRGAMLIFCDAEAAATFAEADPYRVNGLVARCEIVAFGSSSED
jgi:uncharacterized protein YciI